MKKRSALGLVVEGNSTNSVILRLPGLADCIGPIKAAAPRVAKRLSKFLRGGYAVSDYVELQDSDLILIRAPDASLPRIVHELCSSELDFRTLSVALCESWVPRQALDVLRQKGASVATLMPVPSSSRQWFVVDGDARALRHIRHVLEQNDAKALELRNGGKEFYFAAALLATALPIPLYAAAQQALRTTGISGKHLQVILGDMAEKMFRNFQNASRIKWEGPVAECTPEVAEMHFHSLARMDSRLADLVDQASRLARDYMPPTTRGE